MNTLTRSTIAAALACGLASTNCAAKDEAHSESVTWFVLKNPVPAAKSQLDTFGKRYALNARPVQPVNGRAIRTSN